MANNTPRHNSLTIALAEKLEDPLTAGSDDGVTASTDGRFLTSLILNTRLNDAYKFVANLMVQKLGVQKAVEKSQGLMQAQAFTTSATGTNLNADVVQPYKLVTTLGEYKQAPKNVLDGDRYSLLTFGYAVEGGKIYVYRRVAGVLSQVAGDAATLYYVGMPRVDVTTGAGVAVNTLPDVTLDGQWLELAMLHAAYILALDQGDQYYIEKAATFQKEIDRQLALTVI